MAARETSCRVSRKRYSLEVAELELLREEAHRVGEELAGVRRRVVIAVGKRAASLEGIGFLSEQPGLLEWRRGPCDVPHAAAEEDVVDTLADQRVELNHHRLDGVFVPLKQVDRPNALLARGVQAACARRVRR